MAHNPGSPRASQRISRLDVPPEEVASTVEARRELGAEMEPQVVDAFLERIEHAIDARVDERLAERGGTQPARGGARPAQAASSGSSQLTSTGLAVASIALGIPITAISLSAGLAGIIVAIVAWIAIAAINVVNARR